MKRTIERIKFPAPVIIAAFIIIVAGVIAASHIVIPFLLALFISIICYQPIVWLKKRKVPDWLAVTLVFLAIVLIFFILGEIISASLSSFSEDLHHYERNLEEFGEGIIAFLADMGINISMEKMMAMFEPDKVMHVTAGVLTELGAFLENFLTVFFLAVFLLLEVDVLSHKTQAIIQGTDFSFDYLNKIGKSIRHYLSIKTLISLITGVSIWIALAIIGVDYAIIWALIAFLLNYIPNIGSIIAGFFPAVFALIQLGVGGMIWVIGVFLVVNMIIGNGVEPKIMGKGMGLSTFVVFFSLIFWGYVLGTVGMFLSVPLTMSIKIMLEQNSRTRWVAILMSSPEDARALLGEKDTRL